MDGSGAPTTAEDVRQLLQGKRIHPQHVLRACYDLCEFKTGPRNTFRMLTRPHADSVQQLRKQTAYWTNEMLTKHFESRLLTDDTKQRRKATRHPASRRAGVDAFVSRTPVMQISPSGGIGVPSNVRTSALKYYSRRNIDTFGRGERLLIDVDGVIMSTTIGAIVQMHNDIRGGTMTIVETFGDDIKTMQKEARKATDGAATAAAEPAAAKRPRAAASSTRRSKRGALAHREVLEGKSAAIVGVNPALCDTSSRPRTVNVGL